MHTDSPSEMIGITASLANFIETTRWEDLPNNVRHESKRALLNYFAAALGGHSDPAVVTAASVFNRFRSGAEATVIGHPERSDVLHAASLNAMSANALDFDDTHIPTIIHPTAPIAPVLFAMAEASPITGEQLLAAFALGVEVACRIGCAITPGHYARGWHITSTCGVFGSAAAAGKVLKLDAKRLRWALGAASAQASGLVQTIGSMAKSIGVGNAASNGLLSALLAEQGFDAPDDVLEGVNSYLNVACENPSFEELVNGLGTRWELNANTYKAYPSAVVLNPVIEACLELSGEGGFSVADICGIKISGHPLLRERADRPLVKLGREAKVSAQHAVAVALVRGRAGLNEFSNEAVNDPQIRFLGRQVEFINDEQCAIESARVTLSLCNAPDRIKQVENARGSLARPLSDSELERKFVELLRHSGLQCHPERMIDAIWALDKNPDAGSIMELIHV